MARSVFDSKTQIKDWLRAQGLTEYFIYPNLLVDVYENVRLRPQPLSYLPVNFNHCQGDFRVSSLGLLSLEGCPSRVDKDFDASNNRLTSLKGSPAWVGGSYRVSHNHLESLDHSPEFISNIYYADNNPLATVLDLSLKSANAFDDNEPVMYVSAAPHILVPGLLASDVDYIQTHEEPTDLYLLRWRAILKIHNYQQILAEQQGLSAQLPLFPEAPVPQVALHKNYKI